VTDADIPELSEEALSISADDLESELAEALGEDLEEMNDKELATAAAVAAKLGKSGINAGNDLSKQLAAGMYKKGNKYMYRKYSSGGASEYVSLKTIAYCTTFRYFYDDARTSATMTSNSLIYIFKRGSALMYKQTTDSAPESLAAKPVVQGDMYLSEEDAMTYFGCSAEYLKGTNYALCITPKMQADIEQTVDAVIDSIN
jgi:hypothetical protein